MSAESAYKCAVFGCLARKGHQFPEDAELRKKWVEVLAIEDCTCRPIESSIVCQKHFLPGDYDNSIIDTETGYFILKEGAVPSANLEHVDDGPITLSRRCKKSGEAGVQVEPIFVGEGQALTKSACKKCNQNTLCSIECASCERHFQVRCVGRAPVVFAGFDFLKCRKKVGPDSESDPDEQSTVVIDDDSDDGPEPKPVAIKRETRTHEELVLGDPVASALEPALTKAEVITEWYTLIDPSSTSIGSSADDELAIPIEEVIIKEEPDDNIPDHSLDMVEDALSTTKAPTKNRGEEIEKMLLSTMATPIPKRVNQSGIVRSWGGPPVVVRKKNLEKGKPPPMTASARQVPRKVVKLQNFPYKRSLLDFTEKDMETPHYAIHFYKLAQKLLKANLLLSDKNKKLSAELKELKKVSALRTSDGACANCNRTQSKAHGELAKLLTNHGSLKRKAEDEDEPSETIAECSQVFEVEVVDMARVVASDDPLTRERKAPSTPNAFEFDGPYRIVALEYFVDAITDMQYNHSLRCLHQGQMKVHSETLSGISGVWTFRCSKCKLTRSIRTDLPCRVTNRESWNPWLKWLGSLPQRHLGYARTFFANLDVPFFYNFTPTTLKVVVRKRLISANRDWPTSS